MLPELRTQFTSFSESAREEAARWFSPKIIARDLEILLREAAAI
jgi:hypothetical protein